VRRSEILRGLPKQLGPDTHGAWSAATLLDWESLRAHSSDVETLVLRRRVRSGDHASDVQEREREQRGVSDDDTPRALFHSGLMRGQESRFRDAS